MTAEEIRRVKLEAVGPVTGLLDNAKMLREIAAQLAELNEWLRTPQAVKDMREAQARGNTPPGAFPAQVGR